MENNNKGIIGLGVFIIVLLGIVMWLYSTNSKAVVTISPTASTTAAVPTEVNFCFTEFKADANHTYYLITAVEKCDEGTTIYSLNIFGTKKSTIEAIKSK